MIAQLTGLVARIGGGFIVLDVHGVGYRVHVPVSVLESLPAPKDVATPPPPVTLVTHMLVREDDISLYGFLGESDLRVFELLLTVSGIGPKAALALLSALPVGDLVRAVAGDDVRTLTRVPGIGAKTAQRMVLELKDRFQSLGFEQKMEGMAKSEAKPQNATNDLRDDVIAALLNLGYNKPDATRATEAALTEKGSDPLPVFHVLLRAALNRLTGGGR
jgi:Holliday junction DNA helicase RuvA